MEDTDLIARVYPSGRLIEDGKKAIQASWRHMPPRLQGEEDAAQGRSTEESTQPDEDGVDPDFLPYLELRFSHAPRTSSGLVFGSDPDISDIVLNKVGISKRHFALTYKNSFSDGCYRLIVRDLGSTRGTSVAYDRNGEGEFRSKFDWIIDGLDVTDDTKELVVGLGKNLDFEFRIIVARHDITAPVYRDNVERFRRGASNAENLFGGLGLQSGPETEGTHTPGTRPIFLPLEWIAQGKFGVVSHHWNVSTGEEYACKEPVGRAYNKRAWEREIDIMKEIKHVSKCPLFFFFTKFTYLLSISKTLFGFVTSRKRHDLSCI